MDGDPSYKVKADKVIPVTRSMDRGWSRSSRGQCIRSLQLQDQWMKGHASFRGLRLQGQCINSHPIPSVRLVSRSMYDRRSKEMQGHSKVNLN